MNYRERFLQIKDFLKPYQKIWENEIMLMYPNPLEGYSLEWIQDLVVIRNRQDQIRIEKKDVFPFIKCPELIEFYKKIEKLTELPQIDNHPSLPEDRFTWLFIIPKKQHEIKALAPHIRELYSKKNVEEIIDIGGGIGLLAQTLNNAYNLNVTSIDMNPELQKTGFERHEKNAKNPQNKVKYKNLKVSKDQEFTNILNPKVMPVGLHTCGRLALDFIKISALKRVPALVNFGCCYHTLCDSSDLQNISAFAQNNNPLWLNKFALTLSCRAHKKMEEKDFDLKVKVKLYRYAIHILFYEFYQMKELVTLGNSSPHLYDQDFAKYSLAQMERIGVKPLHTFDELNDFFIKPDLQELIQRMMAADLIRNALGRVLEVYLLLDRAIYLEEQGYQVKVQEFFNEEISPRNIGITAELSL